MRLVLVFGFFGVAGLGGFLAEFFKAFDPAHGVDVLHLSGEKRMAGGADFHTDFRLGGAGGKLVAAGTGDLGVRIVFGVDG